MERRTIVLGTYGANWDKAHSACMIELQRDLGVEMLELNECPHIDMARSVLATAALDQGADVAFFIDHDILFDPGDVLTLADQARQVKGIVGAAYAKRRMGAGIVGGFTPETGEIVLGEGGALYPAGGALGMGFTAIHRDALDKVRVLAELPLVSTLYGRCYPYFEKIAVDGYWMSEDASFCHLARLAGVGCFTDTRISVLHRGNHDFSVADAALKHAEIPKTVRLRTC